MFTPATQPQSIGGILDSGFKLFNASLKQVAPIAYLGALAGALWGWFTQAAMLRQISENGTVDFNVPMMVSTYIVTIIVGSTVMAAAIIRIRAVYESETMSFGQAMFAGLKRAPAVFIASIIYMLAFMGGSILLLVPGIYISVMLAFAFYAASADSKGPLESCKYSYRLVKGNWWRTAGLLTIIVIIAIVFYFAVGLVAGMLAVTQEPAEVLQPNVLIDVIIVPIITAIISAMMYSLAYAIYRDLKLRKEGVDLAERIENLDQA
ncbi:MAG: hypothetical protein WBN09_08370 [Woeseiaceae bacterium]